MQNTDGAHGNERRSEEDVLDLALDEAVRKYAAVEPRPGLEQRVRAQLQSESTRLPRRSGWQWSAAGAIAALLVIVAALAWRSNKPVKMVSQQRPSSAVERAQPSATRVAVNSEIQTTAVTQPRHKAMRHHIHQTLAVADAPKLDQFPSPEPLTKEELALVRYVRGFRQDAVIVANAQEEFEKEVEQEVAAGGPATSNSVEQER